MPDGLDHPVVLLYVHPLLGQGIAQHVQSATGVPVVAVSADDGDAVAAVLAREPRVVIYERCPSLDARDFAAMAPGATFIDVSAAVGPLIPSPGEAPQVETIVRAIDAAGAGARSWHSD